MKTKLALLALAMTAALNIGLAQPVITTQPQSQTNYVGTDAIFSVTATGTEPLNYQWQHYAVRLANKTNATLLLTNVQSRDAGNYSVVVTNVEGVVTSAVATLSVLVPPTISSLRLSGQPQTGYDSFHPYATFSVSPGANVTFTVAASGTMPIAYQWQFNQSDLPGQTNRTLVFAGVQLTNAGDYTVVVTNVAGATSQVATLTVDPSFLKIVAGSIVTDAGFSAGGTWGDYNNDGFLDLFVFNGALNGTAYAPFLYRNNGDGTFSKVTGVPLVAFPVESYSACWGDYDNDGNLDLFVATTGQNFLYHNNGNSTFTLIAKGKIVTDVANSFGAAWGDYDNDGFLDLFVGTFDLSAASHSYLYRNNGDGTFTSITNNILFTDRASSLGSVWGDYDNDGNLDLFVCGGTGHDGVVLRPNRLYHNNGDGTFTKITTGSIATDVGYSGNCAWGDYDNDGFLDLFVGNLKPVEPFLYHNNGDGTFTRITNSIVANDLGYESGCAWGDYDNDGFLDLFVSNRDIYGDLSVVNFLYHNNGDGTFTKITTGSPVNEFSDSWGGSWVDYDNDGFLDLFVARGDGRGNFLYHNSGNSNSWLKVKLIGTVSNRSAVGAMVRVRATIGGVDRWQLRQITGGSGCVGHNELWANFGLGNATNVNTLRIEWPSGTVQEFQNVAPKQILTIIEPPRLLASKRTNGVPQFFLKGGRGFQYEIDSSTDLLAWSSIGGLTITNLNGTARIVDTNPPASDSRFYRAVAR
jgi:hypothetical protein